MIEDDHSGAISMAPDVSLAPWLPDRVVHVRSYSKTHGPDLRLAALGGPASLVDRLVARRMLGPAWTSRMLQSILLDLLTSRDVDRRGRPRPRRVRRSVSARIRVQRWACQPPTASTSGYPVRDERAAILHLAAAGIRVAAGSAFAGEPNGSCEVRVTSALVPVDEVATVASALVDSALP